MKNVVAMRIKRAKEETKNIKEILKQNDEDTKFEDEVMRLGPYIEGGLRVQDLLQCMDLTLLLTATEEILARIYQLRDIEEY